MKRRTSSFTGTRIAMPAVITSALLVGAHAMAQRPTNVTPGEMALIPEYCPDTQGFNYGDQYYNTSPRAAHWVRLMGQSFWAHHHYCWGLIKMRRAMAIGVRPEIREGTLKNAIADFEYVVRHSTPDFVMLPEVFLKIGDAYVLLGDFGNAQGAYAESRRRKPDYWPAYTQWADALVKAGDKKGALAHLEDGLRVNPGDTALRRYYSKLGGNLDEFLRTLPKPDRPASSAAR